MKNGKPYRGIGANYFSLFSRMLRDPSDRSSLENLRLLSKAGIPFVRFMCGGFWPADHKLYLENKVEYFRRLDRVVRTAEECNIGLIPSLFWYYPTVPDIVGEPMDQLGNSSSKSIAFIRRYTQEVVERYKDSPAIWGWEFGNEYNLDVDLPNHPDHRPPVVPQLGTPTQRTQKDELKFEHLRVAMITFATSIRTLDSTRILFTGHAIPRQSAYHHWKAGTWEPDTREQLGQILLRDNPDPIDSITIHLYPEKTGRYAGGATTIGQMLATAAEYAAKARKPLFVGEFGVGPQAGIDQERAVFAEILQAIENQHVALAAFWVFDYEDQRADYSADFQNERAYMIDLVSKANARLRERHGH